MCFTNHDGSGIRETSSMAMRKVKFGNCTLHFIGHNVVTAREYQEELERRLSS